MYVISRSALCNEAEFLLQWDSNPGPGDSKLGARTICLTYLKTMVVSLNIQTMAKMDTVIKFVLEFVWSFPAQPILLRLSQASLPGSNVAEYSNCFRSTCTLFATYMSSSL